MLSPVPNTDCDRAREGASARLDGELGQLDQARLDAHLALCAEACDVRGGHRRGRGRMRATPLEPAPVGLFAPHRRHVARPRFAAAAVAALVVAAAAGSSFLLGQKVGARGDDPDQDASSPPKARAITARRSWQCCGAPAPGPARTAAPSRSSVWTSYRELTKLPRRRLTT